MANRGSVVYTEPTDVSKGDAIKADSTKYLLSVLLVTMNERDSINKIRSNPDNYGGAISQLSGISDTTKEQEMNSVRVNIAPEQPVYASWINTIIKYTNEMVNTCGGQAASVSTVTCQFPKTTTIEKISAQGTVLVVNNVTGEQELDSDGNPIGFITPISVPVANLDNSGNPTYYNSGAQRYTAQIANPKDPSTTITYFVLFTPSNAVTQSASICSNPTIACPNRSRLYDWMNEADTTYPGYVYVCNNPLRQVVTYNAGSISANSIQNVAKGDIIAASTFVSISTNLRLISNALDTYSKWWSNGTCALTCQTACQRSCMISCQNCYGGTCHNQNCGGWS